MPELPAALTSLASLWQRVRSPRSPGRRGRTPAHVTALELDGQTLRVVQAVPRGDRAAVTRVLATPLPLPADADRADPAVMGRALAEALSTLGLKPNAVVMGVPRAQVVLRPLTLPAIEDIRQLASMVHFQISRDLPFRLQDAVVDFRVRSSPVSADAPGSEAVSRETPPADPKLAGMAAGGAKVEVLVAAAQREVVEFYEQVAEAAGLRLAALGLLAYANVRCVQACIVAEDDRTFALVSLRPDEVSIDVIARESLLFSRGAAVRATNEQAAASPAAEPAAAEKPEGSPAVEAPRLTFADAATIEVVRSLHSYSGMDPQNPAAKVIVTGATGQEAAVAEALGKRLSVPCALLDLGPLGLPQEESEAATASTAAIGLALGAASPAGLPFDFLNPKHPAVPRDLRRLRILAGLAAAAAALVFLLAIRGYLINQRERVRRDLAVQLAEAEKKGPIYRRMIQQASAVDDWAREGRNWLDQYAYLSAVLPPSEEVYVTQLSVSGQGTIRLAVQARSGETLAKLEKQLRAAGYDVKPLAITPGADRFGYEFRSTVELLVPDKLKVDLTKVKVPPRPADDASLDPAVNKGGGG
jgi:Tfp pilus assembly PilM family ATPase